MSTKWAIDTGHSQIQFKVKHLAIANVTGTFKTFSGSVETEAKDFAGAKIYFEMKTDSIDTNNAQRDEHLKGELFLNVQVFPKISFNGTLQKEDEYTLSGDLTILNDTKPIIMNVEYTGTGKGRFNDTRAGFEISGKLNRKDFGLTFNLANEVGELVVGNEVKLIADIELMKQ